MLINNQFHLTYCTNIHPGSDWEKTFNSLKTHVPKIKKQVAHSGPFGLGLRLSNKASEELNEGNYLNEFKAWLDETDVYVFTMNGFPYGNFHGERVKENVHAPDWTTRERVTYTKRLFNQLSELIPEGMDGGISTSPLTYKHWYASQEEKRNAFKIGAKHLIEIALQLYEIESDTGKYLHLDIEPEPDGLIESSKEFLDFFNDYLMPVALETFKKELGFNAVQAERAVKRYITMCYDICHFSLAYEEPEATFHKLRNAGIVIGKIQVSAALKIRFENEDRDSIWQSLSQFNEPTYLHQVTTKVEGTVKTYSDLPILLEEQKEFSELRAHFHVPIFLEQFDKLFSTQDQIIKVVDYIKSNEVSNHLEIETYTWDVLPVSLKKGLSESIIREINWLKKKLGDNE